MCGGNVHVWVKDILGKSVQFYEDTNKFNIRTALARRNTQLQEEQGILSMIQRQVTESLPQAGNDQTTNL